MARNFDGTNDYLDDSSTTWDQGADDLTIFFWNNVADADGQGSAFGAGTVATNAIQSHAPFTTDVLFWDRADNVNGRISTDYSAFDGKYTAVGLISKLSATTEKAIFLDGTEITTSSTVDTDVTDLTGIEIGRFNLASIQWHKGDIAEFTIWKTTLTDNQMAALANGIPSLVVSSILPYLYVPCWGLTDPEPDFSGNGFNFTVIGATQANHPPMELLENYL